MLSSVGQHTPVKEQILVTNGHITVLSIRPAYTYMLAHTIETFTLETFQKILSEKFIVKDRRTSKYRLETLNAVS